MYCPVACLGWTARDGCKARANPVVCLAPLPHRAAGKLSTRSDHNHCTGLLSRRCHRSPVPGGERRERACGLPAPGFPSPFSFFGEHFLHLRGGPQVLPGPSRSPDPGGGMRVGGGVAPPFLAFWRLLSGIARHVGSSASLQPKGNQTG